LTRLRDLSFAMAEKPLPARTIDRKAREAAALKANMKKRKAQAALGKPSKVVVPPKS
jgi:hypothetical protein